MKSICLVLIMCLLSAVQTLSQDTAGTGGRYHTIARGETLYRLTIMYGVTAQEICDANPGLSAENFKAGTIVLIPPAKPKTETVSAPDTTIAVSTQKPLGLAGSPCKEMHKAKRKETLFSIAQKYGITLEWLQKANPETLREGYALKKGDVLCIPFPPTDTIKKTLTEPTNTQLFEQTRKQPRGMNIVRLAVILPFKARGSTQAKMLDFYRGVLMAVDSLKHGGTSFEIYAYSVDDKAENLDKILQQEELSRANIIFGPADSAQIAAVSRYAKAHGMLHVNPFYRWSLETENNPKFFTLNPPTRIQDSEAVKLLSSAFEGSNIVLLETGARSNSIATRLRTDSLPHRNVEMPHTEKGLAELIDPTRRNVLIPSSSDIKSLNVLMPLYLSMRRNHPEWDMCLVGYSEWQTYAGTLLEDFYKGDTYIFTPFFLKREDPVLKQLESTYLNHFGKPMPTGYPRMTVYGYDCAMHFLSGMIRWGTDFDEESEYRNPLQHSFRMKRKTNWGGLENHFMQFIHYKTTHDIESITLPQ